MAKKAYFLNLMLKRMHDCNYSLKHIVEIIILLLLIIGLGRYGIIGTQYFFNTDTGIEEEQIDLWNLSEESTVSETIVLDGTYFWNSKSWGIKTLNNQSMEKGGIRFILRQDGKIVDQTEVDNGNIPNNSYIYPRLRFSDLNNGVAEVVIEPYGSCAVSLISVDNQYDFGYLNMDDKKDTGRILVQSFRLKYNNLENKLAFLFYVLSAVLMLFGFMFVTRYRMNKMVCPIAYAFLILIFSCIAYLINSEIFIEPVYAEAVTNFMHHAKFSSFADAIKVPDAYYLPLMERLISIFFIKILHMPVIPALYLFQILAVLCAGGFFAFFVAQAFSGVLDIEDRYIIIVLMMVQCCNWENITFINYIIYGCFLFLFYLSDKEIWSKPAFALVLFMAAMTCMSKGSYVVAFPVSVVVLVFFYQSLHRRERIYTFVLMLASLVQFVFSYLAGAFGYWGKDALGIGNRWIYYVKVAFSSLRLFVNSILSLFGNLPTYFMNVCTLLIFIALVSFIYLVYSYLRGRFEKKEISESLRNIMLYSIFLLAFSAFFIITKYTVGNAYECFPNGITNFMNFGVPNRYLIVLYVLAFALVLSLFQRFKISSYYYAAVGNIGICAIFILMLVGNTQIDLNWFLIEASSSNRINVNEQYSDVSMLKYERKDIDVVAPILPNGWEYKYGECLIWLYGNDAVPKYSASVVSSEVDVTGGDLYLQDPLDVNQIFCLRNNLITTDYYNIKLYDVDDNLILESVQSNSPKKSLINFTFEKTVKNVKRIEIRKENGDMDKILNTVYLITAAP